MQCPACYSPGQPKLTLYEHKRQTHYYCPGCGIYGTVSRIDGLPTHPKYSKPCAQQCGRWSPGRQTITAEWICAKCSRTPIPRCTACTHRATPTTRTAPWLPWCTDHRDKLIGPTAIGLTRRDRKKRLGKKARGTRAYKKVKDAALERDNHTCTWCGHVGTTDRGRLEVDHIREEWEAPDLLLDIENLQTLCRACHSAKGVAVREALYELARENPLHYIALVDQHIAHARDTKAH